MVFIWNTLPAIIEMGGVADNVLPDLNEGNLFVGQKVRKQSDGHKRKRTGNDRNTSI